MKTQTTAKVTIYPVIHEVGTRITRRTWQAALNPKEGPDDPEYCPHNDGHKTIPNAKACGIAMWRRLPKDQAA